MDLYRSILLSCADDYTGLWEVIRDVKGSYEHAALANVRQITLMVVKSLLERGLIRAGFPKRDGSGFEEWDLSLDQTMLRIEQEWNELGREPTIGDIVWFATTLEGDRVLTEGEERNALGDG